MRLTVARSWPIKATTFGDLLIDGRPYCKTLEDQVREILGEPVASWKIDHETAIGAGTYTLGLVDSPHFGADTITLLNVPGFDLVRIHSGTDKGSTDGCITVGDRIDPEANPPTISGGLARKVLAGLKEIVVPRIRSGEHCDIQILNPPSWGAGR